MQGYRAVPCSKAKSLPQGNWQSRIFGIRAGIFLKQQASDALAAFQRAEYENGVRRYTTPD
jgi:hypothetical protein